VARWIDKQAAKAERQQAHRERLVARAMRHREEAPARAAFAAEQAEAAKERERPARRTYTPGERRLPALSDDDLREALAKGDRAIPRHLDYPHLLMLRERGFTRMVWADVGTGEFGVPSFRGDVVTEVGELWLKQD